MSDSIPRTWTHETKLLMVGGEPQLIHIGQEFVAIGSIHQRKQVATRVECIIETWLRREGGAVGGADKPYVDLVICTRSWDGKECTGLITCQIIDQFDSIEDGAGFPEDAIFDLLKKLEEFCGKNACEYVKPKNYPDF